MSMVTGVLLGLLFLFVALAGVLVFVLLNLNRELQRLDSDTERLHGRMQHRLKQFQAAVPVLAGVRNVVSVVRAWRKKAARKEQKSGKKVRQ